MRLEDSGITILPLAVKSGLLQIQRFKIPYKNLSQIEVELEFLIAKIKDEDGEEPPVELGVQPSTIRIEAGQKNLTNITAKLKHSELKAIKGKTNKDKRYNFMLLARIKDTVVRFSYFV